MELSAEHQSQIKHEASIGHPVTTAKGQLWSACMGKEDAVSILKRWGAKDIHPWTDEKGTARQCYMVKLSGLYFYAHYNDRAIYVDLGWAFNEPNARKAVVAFCIARQEQKIANIGIELKRCVVELDRLEGLKKTV